MIPYFPTFLSLPRPFRYVLEELRIEYVLGNVLAGEFIQHISIYLYILLANDIHMCSCCRMYSIVHVSYIIHMRVVVINDL